MTQLKDFTSSMEEMPEVSSTVRRWLYGTKELERRLSERVLSLCIYFERIPEQSQADYADVLLETLSSGELEREFVTSHHFDENISRFAAHLEDSGDPRSAEKGRLLREALGASST